MRRGWSFGRRTAPSTPRGHPQSLSARPQTAHVTGRSSGVPSKSPPMIAQRPSTARLAADGDFVSQMRRWLRSVDDRCGISRWTRLVASRRSGRLKERGSPRRERTFVRANGFTMACQATRRTGIRRRRPDFALESQDGCVESELAACFCGRPEPLARISGGETSRGAGSPGDLLLHSGACDETARRRPQSNSDMAPTPHCRRPNIRNCLTEKFANGTF